MDGVVWWIVIGNVLLLAISTRWLTIKHPPKPCRICSEPARHRTPRRKFNLHPRTALCCRHLGLVFESEAPASKAVHTHPPRWHFTRLITRGTT